MNTKLGPESRLVAACWIAAALLGSAGARAQGARPGDSRAAKGAEEALKDEARKLWREGLAAAEADDAELALARYRESLALYPHLETLRNLGVVEVAFDEHVAQGANHLAYYLAHAEALPPSERSGLEALLAKAEEKVGRLDIDVEPPTAMLELDGRLVEPPLSSRVLYVLPGRHEIMVRWPHSKPQRRDLELDAGQRETLIFALAAASRDEPLAAAPHEASPRVQAEQPAARAAERWSDEKLWAVLGSGALTAISLGVGAYGHVARSNAKDDADEARAGLDGSAECFEPARAEVPLCHALDDAVSAQETAGLVATAGWISAGTLAAATAAAWLLIPNEPGARSAKRDASVTALGPWASSRGAGWAVSGRF